jgi:hypothetical protein
MYGGFTAGRSAMKIIIAVVLIQCWSLWLLASSMSPAPRRVVAAAAVAEVAERELAGAQAQFERAVELNDGVDAAAARLREAAIRAFAAEGEYREHCKWASSRF